MPSRSYSSGSKYRYGFNGKEVDNSTGEGNLDFGARVMDVRFGRWLSLDPLASKYPSVSPYVFCLDNPVLFIDPDGKVVTIKDVSSYKAVLGTLTAKEIKRIRLNEDGTLAIRGKGLGSTNLQNLRTLIEAKTNHVFITSNKYQSADGEVTLPKETYGRTLFPEVEASKMGLSKTLSSPDNNVYIIIKPNTDEGAVSVVAHEAYGHAVLGERKRTGKNVNPGHEYDINFVEQNEDLKKQGWKAVGEAKENYKNNSDKKVINEKANEFKTKPTWHPPMLTPTENTKSDSYLPSFLKNPPTKK